MKIIQKNITKSIVILVLGAVFFSCNKRLDKLQQSSKLSYLPVSVAENINTKHTDSGRLTSNLISPKMINYSNRSFPYYQFPEGIDLTIFDEQNRFCAIPTIHIEQRSTNSWYDQLSDNGLGKF